MEVGGYNAKMLDVNLTNGKAKVVELDQEVLYNYIGGRGLASYILWSELGSRWEEIDPLGPENLLLLLTGPLTGYYPGVKLCVSGKSPQSNGIIGSVLSSEVAIELKAAGYDGIIIRGESKDPVYLMIEQDNAEIRDASKFWGLGGKELFKRLREEVKSGLSRRGWLGSREPAFIYIGVAGENKVRMAAVMAKLVHAAGYGGYGAVMGSKKLKAVAVKGYGPMPPVKHPGWLKFLIREAWGLLAKQHSLKHWGTTASSYLTGSRSSSEPIRNWQEEWHDNRSFGPHAFEVFWVKRHWGDYGCPTTCMKISYLRVGKYRGALTDGPDYELQAYLGTNLGVFEPKANIYLSSLADELGLCGIQTGNLLGFVAELFERGILSEDDLDGVKVKWGDADAFAKLMVMIAKREGIGDLLAEGTARVCTTLSKLKKLDLCKYAVHVKGVAVGAHGVRSKKDYAQQMSYALSTQGGDHTSIPLLPPLKRWGELWNAFNDSAVICSFNVPEGAENMPFEFLKAVTGWDIDLERWGREHGRRILSIQRITLLLGGPDVYWDPRVHDRNPPRFHEPLPGGPFKGSKVEESLFEDQKRKYYEAMGWDEYGLPTPETLKELGLGFLEGAIRRVRRRLGL